MKSLANKLFELFKNKFKLVLLLTIVLAFISVILLVSNISRPYSDHAFLGFLISFIFYIDSKKGRGIFSRVTFWRAFGDENPNEKYKQFCLAISMIGFASGIVNLLGTFGTFLWEMMRKI